MYIFTTSTVLRRFTLLLFLSAATAFLPAQSPSGSWIVKDPFIHKVFIENKGQWEADKIPTQPQILFGMANTPMQVFFTAEGLVYYYNEVVDKNEERKREEGEEHEEDPEHERRVAPLHTPHYIFMRWANMNPNCKIISEERQQHYFTYSSKTAKNGYRASAVKKIIYKDLYPGIDVEYFFVDDKEGFKYKLIVHPGADASQIKMVYEGAQPSIDDEGNIRLNTEFGEIIDHAPLSFYQEIASSLISSGFTISGNSVSFRLASYNTSKTIIIDPWILTSSLGFTGYNAAYDIEADDNGNVYAYGAEYPYELIKYSPGGVVQWVHVTGVFTPWTYYGDFTIDPVSGSVYLIECWNYAAQILKLDNSGTQVTLYPGNSNFQEIYRILFDNCNKNLIMAGGAYGTNSAIMDTTLTNITLVNVLSTTEIGHDMSLLTKDNKGNVFMATNAIGQNFNNVFLKVPSSTLFPPAYVLPDNHNFQESGSIPYINGALTRAGYNGMAANNKFLYTYDGKLIQRWDKNTGILLKNANLSSTSFAWGGLDVDDCGRLYAGVFNSINQYDTNFTAVSTIASMPGPIFDINLSSSNTLYACGYSFIMKKELTVPVCSGMELSVTSLPCESTGSATVSVTGQTGPYTYYWNPSGLTTSSVSGLAGGTYTVTVKDAACVPNTATVSVFIGSSDSSLASITAPDTVCLGAGVVVTGHGGLSYSWSTGDTTQQITVYPQANSSYTVVVTAGPNCVDSAVAKIAVIDWPQALVSGNDTVCAGNKTLLIASGGENYLWSTGETAEQIYVEPIVTTNYWVTVTNGYCNDTAHYLVYVKPSPPASAVVVETQDFTAHLSASGGTSYNWFPTDGLSCVDCPNPVALLDETKTYCVSVADNDGCADTACITIVISSVFIPNAFTPDDDRTNDLFKPVVTDVHNYRFAIFDKWGELLFETTDIESGWNGCYKGRLCQLDVYVYKLWFTDDQYNEDHEIIGRVTLLR